MDGFDPLILVIIAIVLLCSLLAAGALYAHQQSELQKFARRRNGQLVAGGTSGYPAIDFQLGGVPAKLSFSPYGDDGMLTHLDVRMIPSDLRLELGHQVSADPKRKLLGLHDLEIGSPEFDALFVIQGNPPQKVRELLTPPLQAALLGLAKWQNMHAPDLHLHLRGSNLRITKHRAIQNEIELSRFVQFCAEIQKCLEQHLPSGIEFVAATALPQETECQVCGQPLTGHIVFCASCKTPHHLDCWQYFESCAVYGCGQSRYLEARKSA
jgi:hypothetical protein